MELNDLESRLWATADKLWANTCLKPSEFSTPVLGLIFLRYAERRFHEVEAALLKQGTPASEIEPFDYKAEGALYLPENAQFAYLADLPEGEAIGKAINDAMAAVELADDELKGVLRAPTASSTTASSSRCCTYSAGGDRGRRLRQDLRILPRQFSPQGRSEG